MSLKNFIKGELTGWSKIEITVISLIFALIIVNGIHMKDSTIAIISAICGILYSVIAGKGKVSCFFFGLLASLGYSWMSFENALWGNLILYVCYYLPMQTIGIFTWSKNLKKENQEIVKLELSLKQKVLYSISAIIVSSIVIALISYFHGHSPFFDGVTAVVAIYGMYFTVKRYVEQWMAWTIVNGLSAFMWLDLVMHGAKNYATLTMWIVYLILSIYFYVTWKKELRQSKEQ